MRLSYCTLFAALLISSISVSAQEVQAPGKAMYIELLGKGFFSVNLDLPLDPKNRLSLGLTMLDHEFDEKVSEDEALTYTLPTPGVMYLHLAGKDKHYFESGLGVSISPVFWKKYSAHDSPITLHGCLGYRYQRPDHFFFRAGFTPFYRVNWMFLPLVGVSFGYSW